ncbi:MAG: hypothetical protein Q9227_007493 [Pyrenula ochraceoflavens]
MKLQTRNFWLAAVLCCSRCNVSRALPINDLTVHGQSFGLEPRFDIVPPKGDGEGVSPEGSESGPSVPGAGSSSGGQPIDPGGAPGSGSVPGPGDVPGPGAAPGPAPAKAPEDTSPESAPQPQAAGNGDNTDAALESKGNEELDPSDQVTPPDPKDDIANAKLPDDEVSPAPACKTPRDRIEARCAKYDDTNANILLNKYQGARSEEDLLGDWYEYLGRDRENKNNVAGKQNKQGSMTKNDKRLDVNSERFTNNYKTPDPDASDNSLSSGHTGKAGVVDMLRGFDDENIDIDGMKYQDYQTASKKRGTDSDFVKDPTARNKIGTAPNGKIIMFSEMNYAKYDNLRYPDPNGPESKDDPINDGQSLKNNELAFQQLSKYLDKKTDQIQKNLLYNARVGIDNPTTKAQIVRIFKNKQVNLEDRVTLQRSNTADQRDFVRAMMTPNVKTTDLMRFWHPEAFGESGKGGLRIDEISVRLWKARPTALQLTKILYDGHAYNGSK